VHARTHARVHTHTHAHTHAHTHTHSHTHTYTHTHTHARTHARFEFDEIPESDKEEFAEWLEGIRSAEEEQEQEQLEQQQAQETEQQGQNNMQRSGSDRSEDTEGGVFEEHISSSRKLAISGTSATVAHSEGKDITVIYRIEENYGLYRRPYRN